MTLSDLNSLEIHFPERRSSQGKSPAQRETEVGQRIDAYVIKIGLVEFMRKDFEAEHLFFDKMDEVYDHSDMTLWRELYDKREEMHKANKAKTLNFLNELQNKQNNFTNLPEIVLANIHCCAGSLIWNETRK